MRPDPIPFNLPEEIWRDMLFDDPARYPQAQTGLAAERIELGLRALRGMPESAAGGEEKLVAGTDRLLDRFIGALESENGPRAASSLVPSLVEARRLRGLLRAGSAGARAAVAALRSRLPEPWAARLGADDDLSVPALARLMLGMLEQELEGRPGVRRRFLRAVYRVSDEGLSYVGDSDAVRIRPLIEWVCLMLSSERRAGCAFVDVGCSALTGAPGTCAAAPLLRRGGLCSDVHAVDLVVPDRAERLELLRAHGIALYACNPVATPLPRRYDVILLANVHRLLTRALQRRLLENLGRSLSPMGMLVVNWRFSQTFSPALCLRRWEDGLFVASRKNLT